MNKQSFLEQIYDIDTQRRLQGKETKRIFLGMDEYTQLCEELGTIINKGVQDIQLFTGKNYAEVILSTSAHTIRLTGDEDLSAAGAMELYDNGNTLQEEIDAMLDEVCGGNKLPNVPVNESEAVCKCDRLINGHEPGCPYYKEQR